MWTAATPWRVEDCADFGEGVATGDPVHTTCGDFVACVDQVACGNLVASDDIMTRCANMARNDPMGRVDPMPYCERAAPVATKWLAAVPLPSATAWPVATVRHAATCGGL